MAFQGGGIITIDLHGFQEETAKRALDSALRKAGSGVYRIRVIHGYHSGTVLKKLVLSYKSHPKVLRIVPGNSNGDTFLVLREL